MMVIEEHRFNFDIDALTSGDAEYSTSESVVAYDLDHAIDKVRDEYFDKGEVIFRIRYIPEGFKPWQSDTVYLAKGQDY